MNLEDCDENRGLQGKIILKTFPSFLQIILFQSETYGKSLSCEIMDFRREVGSDVTHICENIQCPVSKVQSDTQNMLRREGMNSQNQENTREKNLGSKKLGSITLVWQWAQLFTFMIY